MMPEGQLANRAPSSAVACQSQPPQPPQVPCVQGQPSASFPVPSILTQSDSEAPGCSRHDDLRHFAGHGDASTSMKEKASSSRASERDSSVFTAPGLPVYPPGFEPKQENAGSATKDVTADKTTNASTCPDARVHTGSHSQVHQEAQSQKLYSNPRSRNSYPNPQAQSQYHPHSHTQTYPQPLANGPVDHFQHQQYHHQHQHQQYQHQHQHQHQHQFLPMQPLYNQPHLPQHQSSQMTYPAVQMACQNPVPNPPGQVPQLSMCQKPMPNSAGHVPQASAFHNFDGSGTVIGVPLMGAPVYGGPMHMAPPSQVSQCQQHLQNFQPTSADPQPRKSIFYATKYFQRSLLNYESQPERGMLQQVPWQHPGCERNDSGYGGRRSRFKMGRNFSSNVSKSNTQKACDKQIFLPHDNDHVEERLTSSANESGFLHKVSPYSSNEHEDPRQIQTTANNTPSRSSQIHSFKASLSEENSILDGKSLKSDLCQSSSVDTECFKPQSNPLIHSEQKQVSDENDTVEKNQRPADSKVPSHGYTRKMTRWLEDRRNKYPSPANVQRKVEERRNREDMRDCFNKRQRCDSQVNHNHSAGHYQQQKSRIDKHLDSEVQCMDKDRMECTDYEGNISGHVSGSELHTSGTEMPLEIEDSGPIESPYQCHVSDLEKGNQDENPQCISRNVLFSKESDEELPDPCVRGEIADPSFGFVLKGKRKKRKGDQSPSPGEWQKKLWFKILGPDVGKEKSYFLQCCRFIVNNDFLQGSLDSKLTHFKWAFGKEVSNDDNAPIVMMDTTENPALPAGERAMDGLGESYPVVGTVQSIHADVSALEDAQECQNSCMSASSLCSEEPQSKINEEKATPSQAISSEEELGCNREKEQLNNTTATQAEKLSSHEMSCAVSSGQASHIKSRGLIEEPSGYVVAEDKLRCGVKQQEPSQHEGIANSSTRLCTGNNVGDLHPDFQMLSQNSGTDGFVDNAEASVLFEPSCTQYERAVCSWRHGDTCDQKDGGDHLILKHDDCFKSSSYASDIVTDPKQTALSVSNLESQGSIPAVWEQRIADPNLSGYSKNTDDLGIGMCDNFLDEDEILQYMNFDAFDTDTGICYS